MRRPVTRRARRLQAAAAAFACALALLPAAALAEDQPIGQLRPVDPSADAGYLDGSSPSGGASLTEGEPGDGTGATPVATAPATDADDLDGTIAELRAARTKLDAQRTVLQQRLLELEATRERAEERLDTATDAIAARLVALLDANEHDRLQALIGVRDAAAADRDALVLALDPADRALVVEQDRATEAADATGADADAVRSQVLAIGTRIAAFDAAIDGRATPADARAKDKRYSIDADYVFATGPIPSIGYWGQVSGGSMLSGWTAYAGAALGGVGCTPPDPALHATGQIETGDASWYGPGFDGQGTANGETFDTEAMTAAHKTLPFGTIVRVYSNQTGRCAFVRINDRGPYVDGRIIDLSHAAAEAIGLSGVAPVQVEVWSTPDAATPAT